MACFDGPNIDVKCFTKTVKRLSRNLAYVIKTLRKVAGPNVPIVGMDYYNPLLVFWFEDPRLAMQTTNIQNLLNNALLKVYARYGIPVADVSGVFESNNFTDSNENDVPDNVELICACTWMCEWFNIHPNASGYSAIANEFALALPSIPISKPPRRR